MTKKNSDKNRQPSTDMLKTILNGMDACLYVTDIETDEILFINDRMKKEFNLSDDEVLGSICWKVLQSGFEKRCDFCPIYQLVKDFSTPVVWEEHNTVTGQYYKNIDRMIEWSDGKMVHLQHSTDITDIKLAEVALKKRLRQQELMSNISQSFTTMQDTQHLIREALKMAGEFMGINQSFVSRYNKEEGYMECLYEWHDAHTQSFIGGESKWPITQEMDIYKQFITNGYAAINDYNLLTDPNFKTVENYNLRAFLNVSIEVAGEFWGIVGFIINQDSYNWNESDIYLGKLIAGVFSGVISRQISEQQLLNTKEMAEQASKAKGEFLSRMSHEMRTPMNAIIGMTGIAMKSGDARKMEYCLKRIDSASKHLLGLINDILDMSKIEANKLELSSAEFDFEKMLINIIGVVNFRAEEKSQDLIVNIDRDIPHAIIGDEMRLGQVIANLLSNAVKFAPEGSAILLNAHNLGLEKGIATLLFEVIDHGIGISNEQLARLFTPFEQADGSIARKYGGTGLGLTISKGIVELMNGRIWVESELNKGSKFSFIVEMQIGETLPKQECCGAINGADIHVLAVEGNPALRDYLVRVIPEMGFSCDIAVSGQDALEKIKQNKAPMYNVFLIDRVVPDLIQTDLIPKIKAIDQNNSVIMMISESDLSKDKNDVGMSDIDKIVFKPLFSSMLAKAICESRAVTPNAKARQNHNREYNFMGHTLLVAEDIDINREIISAILESTQVSVEFAYNGAQALAMFTKNPKKYSLILMDIQMPEMDGYEAAAKIRASADVRAKSIPIIAMTANVFREDVERCLKAGMNDHIGKPVNTKEVFSKLDHYLNPVSDAQ